MPTQSLSVSGVPPWWGLVRPIDERTHSILFSTPGVVDTGPGSRCQSLGSDGSPPRGAPPAGAPAGRDLGPGAKNPNSPRRVLVIDDNAAIHEDFRKLLCPIAIASALDESENALFGGGPAKPIAENAFVIETALQGREGVECVKRSLRLGLPYALAFVDMRMPPGWDGVETIAHMWRVDPHIEVVVCSAYSDYSWHEVMKRIARPDRVRLLLKPFSSKDAIGLAWERTNRWLARRRGEDDPNR